MSDDYEVQNYKNEYRQINKLLENRILTPVNLEDLKPGQLLFIDFIPYSQKYICLLVPKFGKLQRILNKNELYNLTIINYKNQEERLFHPALSYFGDSLGYDYIINLVE